MILSYLVTISLVFQFSPATSSTSTSTSRQDECCSDCEFQIISKKFPQAEGCYFHSEYIDSKDEEYNWFTTDLPDYGDFDEPIGRRRTLFPGFQDRYYLNFITDDGDDITCRSKGVLPFEYPVDIEEEGWDGCDVNSSEYDYNDLEIEEGDITFLCGCGQDEEEKDRYLEIVGGVCFSLVVIIVLVLCFTRRIRKLDEKKGRIVQFRKNTLLPPPLIGVKNRQFASY